MIDIKPLLTSILIFLSLTGFSQIPPGYYDSANGLTGEPLRIELGNIIDNHTQLNYSNLWTYFSSTDDDGTGKVWDIYSYAPSGSAYTYDFGTDQCGNYSSEGDCYNREHSVPKSWFNDAMPMYSDLFHIYPTDGYVNGMRSNYIYSEVNTPSSTSTNGSKVGPCSYPGCSGTAFEPIDEFKGDIARTYFYMATRYRTNLSSWTGGMFQNDNFVSWVENMLLAWDDLDPVSQKEIDRNNAVYGAQGNRNPFVDHPEWVEYIWGPIADVGASNKNDISMYYYNGVIYVSSQIQIDGIITVYNLAGQKIMSAVAIGNQLQIKVDLENGMYIGKLSHNDNIQTIKFVH